MRNIDPLKLTKNVRNALLQHLDMMDYIGFNLKTEFDTQFMLAEAANKQLFVNTEQFNNINNTDEDAQISQLLSEGEDEDDFAYSFYVPLLSRQAESWLGRIIKGTIPENEQFYRVKFDSHGMLDDVAPEFIPVLEDSWRDFYKKSFKKIQAIPKLIRGEYQSVVYGNTTLFLDYNSDFGLVDFYNTNMKNVALYPGRDDISRCHYIMRHDLFYADVMGNPSISSKVKKKIQGEYNVLPDMPGYISGASNPITRPVPYGYIAASTIFVPNWTYLDTEKEKSEPFTITNALITVIRSTHLLKDTPLEDQNGKSMILRITELDSRFQNPILFSTFGPTMPGTTYYQSKLYQLLPYQAMANLLTSVGMQAAVLKIFPPLKVLTGADETTAYPYEYSPRAIWPVKSMDDLESQEITANLDEFIKMMQHIETTVQKSSGIMEDMTGGSVNPAQRKSAFQTGVQKESGEIPVDVVIDHHENTYLQPALSKYAFNTQFHIKSQVNSMLEVFNQSEINSKKKVDEVKKWKLIIHGDPKTNIKGAVLFKNFLVNSKIRQKMLEVVKNVAEVDPDRARQLQSYINEQFIFEMITFPFDDSAVIIEGNSSQLINQQMLESMGGAIDMITKLKADPSTQQATQGKMWNIEAIAQQLSKLSSLPDIQLLIPIPVTVPPPLAPENGGPMPGQEQSPPTEPQGQ